MIAHIVSITPGEGGAYDKVILEDDNGGQHVLHLYAGAAFQVGSQVILTLGSDIDTAYVDGQAAIHKPMAA